MEEIQSTSVINVPVYRVTALENPALCILRAGNEKPDYMQFSSVYILYGTVNGDVITEVDCTCSISIELGPDWCSLGASSVLDHGRSWLKAS